jgi:hypothetical protein
MEPRLITVISLVAAFTLAAPGLGDELLPPAGDDTTIDAIEYHAFDYTVDANCSGRVAGPITVHHGDPILNPYSQFAGQELMITQIADLDLSGEVTPNPWWFYSRFVQWHLQAGRTSIGMVIDDNASPTASFPAYAFIDLFFEFDLTDIAPVHATNRHALRFAGSINEFPPVLELTALPAIGWVEDSYVGVPPSDPQNPMADEWMHEMFYYDSGDPYGPWNLLSDSSVMLDDATLVPEPAMSSLFLMFGSLLAVHRRARTRTA